MVVMFIFALCGLACHILLCLFFLVCPKLYPQMCHFLIEGGWMLDPPTKNRNVVRATSAERN